MFIEAKCLIVPPWPNEVLIFCPMRSTFSRLPSGSYCFLPEGNSIKSPPTATVSTEHRVKSRTLKQQSKRQTCRARADLGKGYFLIIRAQMKPKVSHYSLSQRIPEWGLYAFKHTARLRFGRAQPDYGYPEATRQDIVVWIKSHSGHRKGAQKDTDLLRSHVQTGIIPLAVPTSGFHKFFYERRVCHNLVKNVAYNDAS